jgi:5-methylcytosine-specific restriction endonuclease McrA
VSLLVRDGEEVRSVGRPVRTIPAKLRRELETTYPVCGVLGCSNDRFLEIDHVIPISEGGETSRANCWRICPHHHVLKHQHGWVVIGEPGQWDLVPP